MLLPPQQVPCLHQFPNDSMKPGPFIVPAAFDVHCAALILTIDLRIHRLHGPNEPSKECWGNLCIEFCTPFRVWKHTPEPPGYIWEASYNCVLLLSCTLPLHKMISKFVATYVLARHMLATGLNAHDGDPGHLQQQRLPPAAADTVLGDIQLCMKRKLLMMLLP